MNKRKQRHALPVFASNYKSAAGIKLEGQGANKLYWQRRYAAVDRLGYDDQVLKGSVAADWVNAQIQKSDDHFKNWIKEAAKTVAYDDLNEHDAREKLRVAISHYANANNFDVQTEYDARLPQLMKSIELQRGWNSKKNSERRRVAFFVFRRFCVRIG